MSTQPDASAQPGPPAGDNRAAAEAQAYAQQLYRGYHSMRILAICKKVVSALVSMDTAVCPCNTPGSGIDFSESGRPG